MKRHLCLTICINHIVYILIIYVVIVTNINYILVIVKMVVIIRIHIQGVPKKAEC